MEGEPKVKRRARRHSPTQLMERPVTIPTCAGSVTISVEPKGRHYRVRIDYPDGTDVDQPDAGASDNSAKS